MGVVNPELDYLVFQKCSFCGRCPQSHRDPGSAPRRVLRCGVGNTSRGSCDTVRIAVRSAFLVNADRYPWSGRYLLCGYTSSVFKLKLVLQQLNIIQGISFETSFYCCGERRHLHHVNNLRYFLCTNA